MASSHSQIPSIIITIFFTFHQLTFARNATIHFPSNNNTSLNWTNSNSSSGIVTHYYPHHQEVRVVLLTNANPDVYNSFFSFALAFYCNWKVSDRCLLAVMLLESSGGGAIFTNGSIQVVWMANRNQLVGQKGMLRAESVKGLVLTDFDHRRVWSTDMLGDPICGMTLTGDGNLVLFGEKGSTRWSSFDNPSDTLVIGQVLGRGKKLKSSISDKSHAEGKFYVMPTPRELAAFVDYTPKVRYLRLGPNNAHFDSTAKLKCVVFASNNITYIYEDGNMYKIEGRGITSLSSVQIMRLDPDGSLNVHVWDQGHGWNSIQVGQQDFDKCQGPLTCGPYGVCSNQGCSCPISSDGTQYFITNQEYPRSGCRFLYHNSTQNSLYSLPHQLVDFGNLSYFSYIDSGATTKGLHKFGACKQSCNDNSTCKAAFFTYETNASHGHCYLLTEVLSIRRVEIKYGMKNSIASIKVPFLPKPPNPKNNKNDLKHVLSLPIGKALASMIPVVICLMLCWAIWWSIKGRKRRGKDGFEQILSPKRFTCKELWLVTKNFSITLGRGGYGTVYKGELKDGTQIAVKRLDHVDQGTSEFLAEMKTMGNIHHLNLVKLLGFCANESHRLLVYEYMSNGSLDKWIFAREQRKEFNWETRRRIILDVARGLAYLHEECSQRIVHLDMKPHNILLDENFNAKISDFGLARFIDRNKGHIFTGMKGTLGYLAPEWTDSKITVKVDIYSFGIVVLEIVSGRMNVDFNQLDPDVRLLAILQRKAREAQLIDIVDKKMEGWEYHEEDIVNMIRIGAWCLNADPEKRPLMSTVVKVLEGTREIECNIEFKFAHTLVLSSDSLDNTSCNHL